MTREGLSALSNPVLADPWLGFVLFRLQRNSPAGFWVLPRPTRALPLTREGLSALSNPVLADPWLGFVLFRLQRNSPAGFWVLPRPTRALPLTCEGLSALSNPVLADPWSGFVLFRLRRNSPAGFLGFTQTHKGAALDLRRAFSPFETRSGVSLVWLCQITVYSLLPHPTGKSHYGGSAKWMPAPSVTHRRSLLQPLRQPYLLRLRSAAPVVLP